jgi:hypothetical protein
MTVQVYTAGVCPSLPPGVQVVHGSAWHQLGTDIQRGYLCAAVKAMTQICVYRAHVEIIMFSYPS